MANASNNHHNGNNQPRRKRNKKPVKRYSEEYNNRPNPYTGYSADGNYHPEAKKRTVNNASSSRAKAVEEERYAALNAAMTEAAWGPAQPSAQQPPPSSGYVPPTVTMPAPRWAASNNMTRQQMAAQEHPQTAPTAAFSPAAVQSGSDAGSGSSQPEQTPSPRKSGSHRKKNHRSKEEAARERAAKTEAKRAAMDQIAKGVAAHSVTEQMIDDIASMSDVIENMPKQEKIQSQAQNPTQIGVNWEEFYDAAFPPKPQENTKFSGKKNKPSKKRIDFQEETPDEQPMTVKPVLLGDNDPLPYDKIVRENDMEAAREKAAEDRDKTGRPAAEPEESGTARQPETSGEIAAKEEKAPLEYISDDPFDDLLPLIDTPASGITQEPLEDISEVVGSISIEDILAAVQQRKTETEPEDQAFRTGAETAAEDTFSFDSTSDDGWNEMIPPRSDKENDGQPSGRDEESLLSDRLMQSFIEAGESSDDLQPADEGTDDQEIMETVDLNQFLQHNEQTAAPSEPDRESQTDESSDITEDFVPEVIIDSAELEKEDTQADIPSEEETVAETQLEEKSEPEAPAAETEPETKTEAKAEPEAEASVEAQAAPVVDVIVADLEEDIFGETKVSKAEGEAAEESGDTVQNKIDKLAEAAELAEVLRQESEDVLPDESRATDESGIFSVSIDDIAVTPEVRKAEPDEESVKEYRPREKTREPDENLFESVLIVDDNPSMIDAAAGAGQDDTLFLHSREHTENPTAVFKLPEGPIVFPTDIDDAEFQEQWLDEDEDGDDMASRNKRTRRRISAFIGAVVLLFAVMILFSAVKTVVSGFTNIGSTSEKKTEYTEFISPVVLTDPMPFESVEKADNNMLLQSSIWRALRELDEAEGYEHVSDATNKIVLPADNVERASKELFGSDVQINLNVLNESDGSAIYYYDSIDNSFHITRSGIVGPSAVITKIAQKSDYISLVVGYSSLEEMSLSSENTENECYKFMEYVLALKPNGDYYIKSIRNYVDN